MTIETDPDGAPYVQIGQYQLRLELEPIEGTEFQLQAETELQESMETVTRGLEEFRQLLEADSLILSKDDDFLIKFLRPFKFDAKRAFKVTQNYYKFKINHPKYCGHGLTPEGVRHVFDAEVFQFLPTRSQFGGRIMIINAGGKWQPKLVPLESMFRSIMVAIEIAMMEPKTQVGGASVIIDMHGLTLSHVYQFSPSMAKLIVDWVQECAPVRLRGIHIINQPYLFNMLYALFKPFLGEYLKKRLSFHGKDYQGLCDKVGINSLPAKWGGNAAIPDYRGSDFSEMLFYYQDKFKELQTYGYLL